MSHYNDRRCKVEYFGSCCPLCDAESEIRQLRRENNKLYDVYVKVINAIEDFNWEVEEKQ